MIILEYNEDISLTQLSVGLTEFMQILKEWIYLDNFETNVLLTNFQAKGMKYVYVQKLTF